MKCFGILILNKGIETRWQGMPHCKLYYHSIEVVLMCPDSYCAGPPSCGVSEFTTSCDFIRNARCGCIHMHVVYRWFLPMLVQIIKAVAQDDYVTF